MADQTERVVRPAGQPRASAVTIPDGHRRGHTRCQRISCGAPLLETVYDYPIRVEGMPLYTVMLCHPCGYAALCDSNVLIGWLLDGDLKCERVVKKDEGDATPVDPRPSKSVAWTRP